MEEPKPAQNGFVKNHHRRFRSEDLNVDETQGSIEKKRKLFFEQNVDETPGTQLQHSSYLFIDTGYTIPTFFHNPNVL
ncbi:unnamed protein product [Cuscuta campestris]|uniref:Uncharacterized protein n=1 Tax=Cuscuta campestris TaxID=132261 RepID=A0A484LVG8_9ASTE|nr:unnamed protein product [Cuscuta campestris]